MIKYRKFEERPNASDSTGGPIFVVIDLLLKNWHATVMEDGRILFSGSISGRIEHLFAVLQRFVGFEIHAVDEAGYFGF